MTMRDKNRREDKEKRDCRRLEGPPATLYNPEQYRVEHKHPLPRDERTSVLPFVPGCRCRRLGSG